MARLHKLTVLLMVAFVTVAAIASAYSQTPANMSVDATEPVIDLTTLSDSSIWKQVNSTPYVVTSQVNVLCAAPTALSDASPRNANPHAAAAITVFVNNSGARAMMSQGHMAFPEGSVIVKKKTDPRADTDAAILYTVMIKHGPGYNSEAGDWEFAVVGADAKEIQARGALANCIACHQPQRKNDFVFRTYLAG